jgi:L-amino acid N-acyltransferase YncA
VGELLIRDASDEDAAAIAAIYAHHVLHGTATYDIEPPSTEEILAKLRHINAAGWPFLVANVDGEVAGYAYATQFRDRAAYRFACENSIYVAADRMRRGIGRALLSELIDRSSACGFQTMVAVVGGAEPGSIALHAALGFEEAGRLKRVGFKFDSWLDSVYMQRALPRSE